MGGSRREPGVNAVALDQRHPPVGDKAQIVQPVVQVGQRLYNKNNQTLAVFGIWMAFYLICSLSTSLVVNTINRRLEIVER